MYPVLLRNQPIERVTPLRDPYLCDCGHDAHHIDGPKNVVECEWCGTRWYISRCWKCKTTIDSRVSERSPANKWRVCINSRCRASKPPCG